MGEASGQAPRIEKGRSAAWATLLFAPFLMWVTPVHAEQPASHHPAAAASGKAAVVPMPRPRPETTALPPQSAEPQKAESAPAGLSPCQTRLDAGLAITKPSPPITGPGACHAEDVVQLIAIITTEGTKIKLSPPATLRCEMAEALARWVREQAEPRVRPFGAPKELLVAASFSCRGRNNVSGAKLSEHGLANAIDLRGFMLADGKSIILTDANADKNLRGQLRDTACGEFTTVLGPGSDGYHEEHIHLDHIQRRSGYRMCQWAVRVPGEAPAARASAESEKATSKAAKKAAEPSVPIAHADGGAPNAVAAPPLPIARPSTMPRAARSASCGEGRACPRSASPRRERAHRRARARRSVDPLAIFHW